MLKKLLLSIIALILLTVFLLICDLRMHRKLAEKGDMILNRHGYQGEILGRKRTMKYGFLFWERRVKNRLHLERGVYIPSGYRSLMGPVFWARA